MRGGGSAGANSGVAWTKRPSARRNRQLLDDTFVGRYSQTGTCHTHSVFGLTRGSDGQFLLVSLASAGAAAQALPIGELLPFCQVPRTCLKLCSRCVGRARICRL